MNSKEDFEKDKEIFEKWILSKPWIKFYDKETPKEVEIPEIPLYELLDNAYKIGADHVAMIFLGNKIKYRDLHIDSEKFGNMLVNKFSVKKGDKIALYLPNSPQFAVVFYGIIKVGGIATPMNPLYTAREVAYQIKDSGARILIALDLFKDHVENALREVDLDAVIYTGIDDYLPPLKAWIYRNFMKKVKAPIDNIKRFRYKDLLREAEAEAPRQDIDPKKDPVALMYTGGTTGIPKGAVLTHYNIVSNLVQIDSWLFRGRKKYDKYVGILPWYHIYGMTTVLHSAIYSVGTIVIFPKFDIKEILEGIQKYKTNVFHGVPTIYSVLVNYPEINKYDLRSIEACVSGAGPLPVAIAKKFEEITGGRIREGYGLTETSPVTHVNPIHGKYKFGSIGLPVPNTLAAIADPEKPIFLEPGKTGELVISGPQVMKEYYNRPDDNKSIFFEKYGYRWLRTGDIAYMDKEGYFYIVDRKKDLIKYKGYSVYPREIEEVLYHHEAIAEAAVVGVPDEKVGERIKAFIVLKNEYRNRVSEEDIKDFLRKQLAPYKMPKEIEFRDSLPKSAAGKILRRLLREEEIKRLEGK